MYGDVHLLRLDADITEPVGITADQIAQVVAQRASDTGIGDVAACGDLDQAILAGADIQTGRPAVDVGSDVFGAHAGFGEFELAVDAGQIGN